MSRSLRSRPLTLYGSKDGSVPSLPSTSSATPTSGRKPSRGYEDAGPSSSSYAQQQQQQHYHQHAPPTSSESRERKSRKAASRKSTAEVGINLKKRLSMRYAEPTELGPGGFSAPVPAVPHLPPEMTLGQPQYRLFYDQSADTPGGDGREIVPGSYVGQNLPVMGDGFDDQGAFGGLEEGGIQPRRSGETSRTGLSSQSRGPTLESFIREPGIDLHMLSKEAFDPQAYLRQNLAGSTSDSAMREFREALMSVRKAANSDLQRQVFRNYHELINISKEIGTLENEMLELKELLKEWRSLPSALELEEGSGTLLDTATRARNARGARTSMLDLQQIYRAQIMSLWETIEGSQKFLPYIPGRHLIAEASSFTELNSATYKPKQGVSLYLLDDLLLVAVRKKRQMTSRIRLVAERCFTLGEIVVIDLKDGGDLTNAVKIKRGKETFVYRTDRAEDKKALLNAFRRVAEELAAKRRKESLAEAEARKQDSPFDSAATSGSSLGRSATSYGSTLSPDGPGMGNSEGSLMAQAAANAAAEKKSPGRWSSDLADELAVAIALREWGDAVGMVEKAKNLLSTYPANDPARVDFASKLSSLTASLIAAISHDLSSPTLKKSAVVRNVGYLLRLDKGERAREIFLAARSELLRRRSRQIKFEGDVGLHISELSLVHFTLVKNTSEWYMSAFKDNRMASGFVRWASAQVEAYAEIFRRQVYGVAEQEPKVIQEAIAITKQHAHQLKEVGLDFGFLLDELLRPGGVSRSIPSLTLTLPGDDEEGAKTKRLSAQELRRQSMIMLDNGVA